MANGLPNRSRRLLLLVVLAVAGVWGTLALGSRAEPVLGADDAPILVAWTSDELVDDLVRAARQAGGIGAVAQARNGVIWLNSWGPAEGPVSSPSPGFMVPVEVLAVDPAEYSAFVPTPQRPVFESLNDAGSVLLGQTGASLRGIQDKGVLNLEEATLQVDGVVPDYLVASHEMVISNETADRLGIEVTKYLILELERGTDPQEAEEALRELLPDDARLGLRSPGESDVFRPGGTILPQAEIKRLFGEFAGRPAPGRTITVEPAWIVENTSITNLPILGRARCHNRVIPQIRGALQEIADRGLQGLIRENDFGGCYAPRFLNNDPHSGISHHTWGIAFDFNVSRNPFGAEPTMDMRLVEIMEEWGFVWGGHWAVPDGMHFEYLTEPDASKG